MNRIFQQLKKWLILARIKFQRRFRPLERDIIIGRERFRTVQRILLCLPADPTPGADIHSFIRNLQQQHTGLTIDFFVPENSAEQYHHLPGVNSVISWEENSFTLWGFPHKSVIKNLTLNRYGMIIDFTQPFDLSIAYMIYQLGPVYRLGVKSPHSSYFYNVEVVPRSTNCFDMILKMLSIL